MILDRWPLVTFVLFVYCAYLCVCADFKSVIMCKGVKVCWGWYVCVSSFFDVYFNPKMLLLHSIFYSVKNGRKKNEMNFFFWKKMLKIIWLWREKCHNHFEAKKINSIIKKMSNFVVWWWQFALLWWKSTFRFGFDFWFFFWSTFQDLDQIECKICFGFQVKNITFFFLGVKKKQTFQWIFVPLKNIMKHQFDLFSSSQNLIFDFCCCWLL